MGSAVVKKTRKAVVVGGLRAYFRTTSQVAPEAAVRKAVDVWCTLPTNAGRRKDNRAEPGEQLRIPAGDGRTIVAEAWGEGPVVYLVHGWGGWRGQVASFAPPLVAEGFRVVTFDSLSHGDSDAGEHGPGRSSGGEMIESFQRVYERLGPAHAVVGHSLGCASACRTLLSGAETERLCLVSPNPDMAEIARRFARQIGLAPRLDEAFLEANERFARRSMHDFDIAPMGATGRLPGATIIHDDADKEVPLTVARQIADAWPGSTLVPTHGLGHHRILIDPDVITQVTKAVVG
ncbi:MAG: alpha/beta hydrolase [Micrococcales bacterium]|nr:alpha/beta hydrolase [Micrococcales bacterium]